MDTIDMTIARTGLSQKIQKLAIYALIVFLPFILTSVLLNLVLDSNLTQYHPYWSDEVDYWTQINSYKNVGFNTGYFSINELTSNSTFSHYGTHGPMYPFVYGNLARLLGWVENSGPWFNQLILSLSLLIFLVLVKPNLRQSCFLTLILIFSYHMVLYLPTTMQESLHFSFAILYSAFLIKIIIFDDSRVQFKIGIVLTVIIASLFRIIWVFTIFPVFAIILNQKRHSMLRFMISIGLSIIVSLIVSSIYIYWTSPYPEGNLYQLMQPGKDVKDYLRLITSIASVNITKLIGTYPRLIDNERIVRILYLVIIGFFLFNIKRQFKMITSLLFIQISTLVLTILIYDIGNFRVIAPFLLIALTGSLFINNSQFEKNTMTIFIILSLLSLPYFIGDYKYQLSNHFTKSIVISNDEAKKGLGQLNYIPQDNPWCNSLLSTWIYPPSFMVLSPGIGTNIILPNTTKEILSEQGFSLQSHYLLVPNEFLKDYKIEAECKVIGSYEDNVLCVRINDNCE